MTYSSHNDKLSVKTPAELGTDLKALESQLLGALIIKDGKIIPEIQSVLTPDDFFFPDYKVIYKAIVDLYSRNTTPSIISVIEELKATGQFSNDIVKSVVELSKTAFTDAYAIADAAKIKEYSTRRKFFELSLHLNRKGLNLISLWTNFPISLIRLCAKYLPTTPSLSLFRNPTSTLIFLATNSKTLKNIPPAKPDFLISTPFKSFRPVFICSALLPLAAKPLLHYNSLNNLPSAANPAFYAITKCQCLNSFPNHLLASFSPVTD